ncbi:MAG TPA: type II TA system antitoxin MqsA family protein [Coriobacteriia bacterium]
MSAQSAALGVCSVCGARGIEMSRRPLDVGSERRPVLVDPGFEYEHCTVCGEDLIPADRMDELFRQAVAIERARDGLLDSEEIRRIRLDLELTQSRLERLLGVSPKTVTRWESGTVRQSRMADNFMRLLRAHPELVVEVAQPVARESRGPYRPRSK